MNKFFAQRNNKTLKSRLLDIHLPLLIKLPIRQSFKTDNYLKKKENTWPQVSRKSSDYGLEYVVCMPLKMEIGFF
jgi:hypothetical protein